MRDYPTWDAPPLPERGDHSEDTTYAGVGRVLSEWEACEAELSHIYAMFVCKFFQPEAYREYGAGRIFIDRLRIIRSAAEAYFVRHPNQEREGKFDQLAQLAEMCSARRNEVAHSIVREMGFVRSRRFGDPFGQQFCLVPSHYNYKRFGPDNMPTYAYTSAELAYLKGGLSQLRMHLALFVHYLRQDLRLAA